MSATTWTTEGGRNDAARERAAAFMRPCSVKYLHPHFQGAHNIVGVYDHGRPVGRRCVSCGASEETKR